MSMRGNKPWSAFLLALMLSPLASADEPPTLKSNPFARPSSAVIAPTRSETPLAGDSSGLELRATMVGSNGRLANVAGRTLRLGDDYLGYTLVQIFEDRAVFSREGRRLTVYVKPELEENDEE